ncbi:hypothetical protein KBD34_03510 [Patescibacteria group bacterium]|nr:hypothetical protein [Patescibacteria group bacterium]
MKQLLVCTVLAVEDQLIRLRTPDGQSLSLPLSCIHGTPSVDGTVRLMGAVPEGGRVDDSLLAKSILNELLSPNS